MAAKKAVMAAVATAERATTAAGYSRKSYYSSCGYSRYSSCGYSRKSCHGGAAIAAERAIIVAKVTVSYYSKAAVIAGTAAIVTVITI